MAKNKRADADPPVETERWLPRNISDLVPDPDNANKHTEQGMGLLESNIRADGLGRSIVSDSEGRIIAGNGVLEAAVNAGITKIIPVETNGDELVVVVRRGVKLDTPQGRRMALADNAIARKNMDLDEEVIRRQAEAFDIDLEAVGLSDQDMAGIRQNTEATELDTSADRQLSGKDSGATVKVVLRVPQVRVFEIALAKTGLMNRADALMEVCRAYGNSKGQLDPASQDQSPPADA